MVTAIKQEKGDLIAIDTGRIFPKRAKYGVRRGELALKVMREMGYEAIGLAPVDIVKGLKVLERLSRKDPGFPVVVSNVLTSSGSGRAFAKRYLILKRGGRGIGVLSVVSQKEFEEELKVSAKNSPALRVVAPQGAIAELVEKIRKEVNIVVLISQLSQKQTFALLKKLRGIDMVIMGAPERRMGSKAPEDLPAKVVWAPLKGDALRLVKVSLGEANAISDLHTRLIRLPGSLPQDKDTASLVKAEMEGWHREERERYEQWRKKILSMTPEEYVQYLIKHGNKPPSPPEIPEEPGCGK